MEHEVFLELFKFEQSDNESEKGIVDRNSNLFVQRAGTFVPLDDKSKLPGGDEYEYVYQDAPEEFPDLEFEPRVAVKCTKKDCGTLYHILQTKWKGIKCYKRYKKYAVFIRYCYPTELEDEIKDAIEDCAGVGFIAALPLIPNLAAMTAAFIAAFEACLIAKGLQKIDDFSFRVYKDSYYTKWKKC